MGILWLTPLSANWYLVAFFANLYFQAKPVQAVVSKFGTDELQVTVYDDQGGENAVSMAEELRQLLIDGTLIIFMGCWPSTGVIKML